jgi:hypothetical protein
MGEMGAGVRQLMMVAAAGIAVAGSAAAQPVGDVAGLEAPALLRGFGAMSQHSATPTATPVMLFHYFNVGPDCRATEVTIRLVTPPAHGAVSFRDGQERPFAGGEPLFSGADPRARCEDRLAPTKDAVYTPAPGFAGDDSFVVEISEAGVTASDAVEVQVLSFGKPFRARYPR